MVTQIASATKANTAYELTIIRDRAISCTCPDHQYRNRACKHMTHANAVIEAEVGRASRFLSLQSAIREQEETARCYREMMYDPRFA
jgi:hypothetical protein